MWFLALASTCLSAILIVLSCVPGFLERYPIRQIIFYPVFGFAVFVAIFAVWNLAAPAATANKKRVRFWSLVVMANLFLTPTIIQTYAAQSIAFHYYGEDFAQLLPKAPMALGGTVPLNVGFGPYEIDRWGTDPRGGVYFRIVRSEVGDRSFGFVHQPNPEGTPFGDENYLLHDLGKGWYSFEAGE
jgi:hypothetical protein